MPYISQEVISYVEQKRLWRRELLDHAAELPKRQGR